MPEEPDGGQDATGSSAVRDDEWADLTPAVRPVTDDEWAAATATDSAADADNSSGDDSDDSSDGDEWEWSYEDADSVGPSKLDAEAAKTDADESTDAGGGEATAASDDRGDAASIEPAGASVEDSDVASMGPESVTEDENTTVIEADETPNPTTGVGSAPETDVEQPLAVHVEEMVKRLAIVIVVAALASVVVFPVTEGLVSTIWNHVLPGGEAVDPRVYHPLELLITQLKVASLAGLVVALPVFVYQSYVFMRPGLYKRERRYYLAAVPTSLVLAVLGVVFSYFVVLPYTMDYFQGYTQGTADVAFALGTTFNLILMVMGYLAVVFQIPLFIMLAIMLGVVSRRWLEDRRILFWGAFAGIAFAFGSIDPTGVVPVLVAITMIVLFEGTLALLRWTGN